MNGGDGPYSYARNSSYQRGAIDAAKVIINKEIATKLNLSLFSSKDPFRIVDLGCSSGPNTIIAVQIILEAVEQKFKSSGLVNSNTLNEFQVFFNDHLENDFNNLFALLPLERRYHAAGVPGSFYSRLFPKASLHIAYSSCALCWLSVLPKEILDKNSPAFNKGRIHYTGAQKAVLDAYSSQYRKDSEAFLHARAEELVSDGLMILIIPGVPDGFLESQASTGSEFDLLGSCLMDMAKKGIIREEEVDSFNLPIYYTSPMELQEIILQKGEFSIERMEMMKSPDAHSSMPDLSSRVLYLRAVLEGLIQKHFGSGIIDQLFQCYTAKVAESSFVLNPENHKSIMMFVLLKRIA